ncbi:MAG: DUF3570 domain-containing protein, partial [Methyloglobulus sp.]|nr:DUF3570 domain-containing protein [Methyloglobulus sp.]
MRHRGAVVGVIKKNVSSLRALTATALSLPGLLSPVVQAADGDEVDFQYSHYQEGKRDIAIGGDPYTANQGAKSFNPIEVDSLHGGARISLTDRVKFAFNYIQDTWGGATPVSTEPFDAAKGNQPLYANNASSGTVVGASPYVQSPLALDSQFNPLSPTGDIDPNTALPVYKKTNDSNKLTHVMATASPETRKQGDFKLSYDWDEAAVSIGGGISIEDDYESRFGNIGGRFDFNQKRTTLNLDLSYTNSETNATLEHDAYVQTRYSREENIEKVAATGAQIVHGNRQDWGTHLGLTQVLNKDALVGADFSYTRSTGYLTNPYKAVSIAFIDPNNQFAAPPGGYTAGIVSFYEQRPEVRNQWNLGGRYVQYISPLDAALHFNYQFSADDWGIQAHTFDVDWVQPISDSWTITPRVRYYSQDAADFYTPWLINQQAALNAGGGSQNDFDPSKLRDPKNPSADFSKYFSSDQRLSGFGTLSGGVTVTKKFAKGLTLETGFEYYTHQGGLKIGGGGEGSYADYDYWVANAALKVNLEAL